MLWKRSFRKTQVRIEIAMIVPYGICNAVVTIVLNPKPLMIKVPNAVNPPFGILATHAMSRNMYVL